LSKVSSIIFSDDEWASKECHALSRGGARGAVKLYLRLGPAIMMTHFVIMDIIPTFKAILGRTWVEQTLGVSSTLHQSYNFPHNGKILKVKSLPQVEFVDMVIAEGLSPSP